MPPPEIHPHSTHTPTGVTHHLHTLPFVVASSHVALRLTPCNTTTLQRLSPMTRIATRSASLKREDRYYRYYMHYSHYKHYPSYQGLAKRSRFLKGCLGRRRVLGRAVTIDAIDTIDTIVTILPVKVAT